MHPRNSKHPAARFAIMAAAAALLSLTAALAQPPSAPQKADEAEARRQEEAAKKAQEKALMGMKQSQGKAPVTFAPIVTDPEGITFGQRSSSLNERTGGEIMAVAFAPDGKVLAGVGSRSGKPGFLKLWDAATGKERAFLRQPKFIAAVAYAPDGKLLATGEAGGVLNLRDPATGKVRRTLGRHGNSVSQVMFAPDGKTLVSAGHDNKIWLWDVAKGKMARALAGHTSGVTGLVFARDGKTLASVGNDATVRLWDWPAGKVRLTLKGADFNGLTHVSLSPNGRSVATVSPYQPVRLWSGETGKETTPKKKKTDPNDAPRFSPPPPNYLTAAYTPDGKGLVAAGANGRLVVLDAKTLEEKATIAEVAGPNGYITPGAVYASPAGTAGSINTPRVLSFAPDGNRLASVFVDDQVVSLWDVPGRKHVLTLRSTAPGSRIREPIAAMACTRDGKTLALALEDHRIALRDVASGDILFVLSGHGDKVTSLAFSPDGKALASGSADNTVKLWDCATGKERRTLRGHGNWVYAVAFAPDGKTVASGGYDRAVKLWDADSGQERATLRGHSAAVRALSFAPDGKLLASGGNDRTIKLWDIPPHAEKATLMTPKTSVRALAFAPDGKLLASAGDDGSAHTWDVATGKRQGSFAGTGVEATSLAFSPTGTRFAVTRLDSFLQVWPVHGERKKRLAASNPLDFGKWALVDAPPQPLVLSGHGDGVMGVAFTPDGREIITGSFDRTVRLWPATTVPVRLLQGHTGWVSGAVFSPDGKYVLTGSGETSGDKSLRLWDFATGKEVRRYPTDEQVLAVAFAPEGRSFAAGTAGGRVRIYTSASGEIQHDLGGFGRPVLCVAFAPGGRRLACGTNFGAVFLWDMDSSKLQACTEHKDAVHTVAFSPDDKRILSGSRDGTMRLWDAGTGKQLREIKCDTAVEASMPPGPPAAPGVPMVKSPTAKMGPPPVKGPATKQPAKAVLGVQSAVFLPNGKHAVCAEGRNLSVWDLESGKRLRKITGHQARVDRVVLTRGGRVAITASQDQSVRLWDLETGAQLASLDAYRVPQAQPQTPPNFGSLPTTPAPPPPAAEPEEKSEIRKEAPTEAKKDEKAPKIQEDARKDPSTEKSAMVKGSQQPTAPKASVTVSDQPVRMAPMVNPSWPLIVAVSPDGRHLLTAGSFPGGPASAANPAFIVRVWRTPATPRLAQAGPGKQ